MDQFEYELDNDGEQRIVSSPVTHNPVYLRFINKTDSTVDLCWRDFRGYRKFYSQLKPDAFIDCNTFHNHAWIFMDAATDERYVVQNKTVFRAPSTSTTQCGKTVNFRMMWNITVPVRELKYIAILTVARQLRDVENVDRIDLPKVVSEDLKKLIYKLNNFEVRTRSPVRS